MTIQPYALTADPSKSFQDLNSLLNSAKNSDDDSLKKIQLDSSKIEQVVSDILETNHNQNIDRVIQSSTTISYTQKEFFIHVIDCKSKDEKAYYKLARLLKDGETATLLNGEVYTKKGLYLKAIHLNPEDEYFFSDLADLLENHETIEFLNGEVYTKKELYLKAIELGSSAWSYYNLADLLENHETIELLNGEVYTKKELYLKAIELRPNDRFYDSLADLLENHETVTLLNGEVYTKKELYLKAMGGKIYPEKELYLKVIDLGPDKWSYSSLAKLLENHETVTLLNGEIYTKKELYLKAIELGPSEWFYDSLADLLKKDETVTLLNGEIYTKKELYLKAIELGADEWSYYSLAYLLEDHETVTLLNGEVYTKKGLYLKAIELGPNAWLYDGLANLLEDHETVTLLNGEVYTKKGLYLKAIELGADEWSYYSLAYLLEDHETVTLLNGEAYTKKELYLKAIELGPNERFYDSLADLLKNHETVTLLNGEVYTKKELYLKAIELGPSEWFYYSLADLLEKDETVTLLNGEIYTKKGLYLKAIELGPNEWFYYSLANLLEKDETVTLLNGEIYTKKELCLKMMELDLENASDYFNLSTLPFLSLAFLKNQVDERLGDYISSRKPAVLQDGIKLTKLMAYKYAYENSPDRYLLTKIGDALHPEERLLLDGKFYDKRTCYKEANIYGENTTAMLRLAKSLYPHEQSRKSDLFNEILWKAYQDSEDRLYIYELLAIMLSGSELTGYISRYLSLFHQSISEYHPNVQYDGNRYTLELFYLSEDHPDSKDELYFTKKQEFLLTLLEHVPFCEEAYVALATSFQHPLMIDEKSYASKEALYLKAIDINPEYSLPYFLLGKALFNQNIENIQLLNGVILSYKQLLMRSIQLGTYEAEAYHLAALLMNDREGILLFDEKTILSRGDLFIRAFELDFTRVIDLKNFISYLKRMNNSHLSIDEEKEAVTPRDSELMH